MNKKYDGNGNNIYTHGEEDEKLSVDLLVYDLWVVSAFWAVFGC
jgi:hypothetical protein